MRKSSHALPCERTTTNLAANKLICCTTQRKMDGSTWSTICRVWLWWKCSWKQIVGQYVPPALFILPRNRVIPGNSCFLVSLLRQQAWYYIKMEMYTHVNQHSIQFMWTSTFPQYKWAPPFNQREITQLFTAGIYLNLIFFLNPHFRSSFSFVALP